MDVDSPKHLYYILVRVYYTHGYKYWSKNLKVQHPAHEVTVVFVTDASKFK